MSYCRQSLSHVRFCNPLDCSPLGFSVPGVFQVGTLEQVAIPLSRGSSQPRDQTHVSCVSCCRRILYLLSYWGSPHTHMSRGPS